MPQMPCQPQVDFDYDFDYDYNNRSDNYRPSNAENDNGNEIDLKAEKFIAAFYEQMKFQRQVSYLQYNEMLNRSVN
ncbi:hypothetical protein Leryth_023252 [Lithospermum erythrorhizon]|nr:hypothetical protein Leryth_023252 [Lithospermum erythrorhizon]